MAERGKAVQGKAARGKKKAAVTAAAVAAAASVAVAGLCDTPGELLASAPNAPTRPAWLQAAAEPAGESPETEEQNGEEKKQSGLRRTLREKLLALPYGVRLVVLLPLWALGSGLLLLGGLVDPAVGKILRIVLILAALAGAFVFAVKSAFPSLPLKKILNRRTVPVLLLGGVLLYLADLILAAAWEDYAPWRSGLQIGAYVLLSGSLVLGFCLRHRRKKKAAVPLSAAPAPKPRRLTFVDEGGDFTVELPE